MTPLVLNYARVLCDLGFTPYDIKGVQSLLDDAGPLQKVLLSPIPTKKEKHRIIERIFPEKIINFMKVMSDYESLSLLPEVLTVFESIYQERNHILGATLQYVIEPSEKELEEIKDYLRNRYSCKEVEIKLIPSPELIGGLILKVGDNEIDWSFQGRLAQLRQRLTRR